MNKSLYNIYDLMVLFFIIVINTELLITDSMTIQAVFYSN